MSTDEIGEALTMSHSPSIASLAAALAAAQGEIENATKNAANPHFKSRYADLAEILNTVRPVLAKHDMAVIQVPGFTDGIVTVSTLLTHSSGEWIRGESSAPIGKSDVQGVGSATTYLRRYSLAAICGIAQEDDDGNGAPPATPKPQAKAQRTLPADKWIESLAKATTADGLTAMIALAGADKSKKKELIDTATARGYVYDKELAAFVEPAVSTPF